MQTLAEPGVDGEASQPAAAWPALDFEQRDWFPGEAGHVPTAARRRHRGPYRAAVVPEIATQPTVPLPGPVLTLADEATIEVTRFDAEVGDHISPFAALLLRSESAASSRIENLTASAKAVALAELGDPRRRNANVIVANTRAMQAAIDLADRLDEQAILDMHDALLGATHPDWVGRWRQQQVWIGGSNHGPHNATFVPPHHDRVPAAIADLAAFLLRNDIPALVHAAVAHAQFETIHPFPDGNGRTGRSLIHALLRARRVTINVTVPVSAGLLTDTGAYFDALTAFRAGNPAPIVESLANAAFAAVTNGRQLVTDLTDLRHRWNDRITARRDAAAWRLADLLIRQPIVDSLSVQHQLDISASNAHNAIDQLESVGILTKVSGQHRNRRWASTQVLAALDDFAERPAAETDIEAP